jgi:hypothetical protein
LGGHDGRSQRDLGRVREHGSGADQDEHREEQPDLLP